MRFCHRACATIFDIPYFAEYHQYECILEKGQSRSQSSLYSYDLVSSSRVKPVLMCPIIDERRKSMTTIAPPPIWTNQAPHQIALDALQQFQWSVFPLDSAKIGCRRG
jgi:hypothetical protein